MSDFESAPTEMLDLPLATGEVTEEYRPPATTTMPNGTADAPQKCFDALRRLWRLRG
jgi:hypothetical protein